MTLAIDRNNNTLYLCASDLSSMYGALSANGSRLLFPLSWNVLSTDAL